MAKKIDGLDSVLSEVSASTTTVETLAVTSAAAVDPASNGPGRYRVTLGELSGEYAARDRNEAWAQFCDAHKTWPSPKYSQRTIERLS
ncbi:MAG: hypothetical protein L0211_09195 [Planctomycetaceae bacterium]|nr:hypothetical protein [Planctomycetaceae bacterium]